MCVNHFNHQLTDKVNESTIPASDVLFASLQKAASQMIDIYARLLRCEFIIKV